MSKIHNTSPTALMAQLVGLTPEDIMRERGVTKADLAQDALGDTCDLELIAWLDGLWEGLQDGSEKAAAELTAAHAGIPDHQRKRLVVGVPETDEEAQDLGFVSHRHWGRFWALVLSRLDFLPATGPLSEVEGQPNAQRAKVSDLGVNRTLN